MFVLTGVFGAHWLYLGNYTLAALYCCTAGFFGIGWILDGIYLQSLVHSANNAQNNNIPHIQSLSFTPSLRSLQTLLQPLSPLHRSRSTTVTNVQLNVDDVYSQLLCSWYICGLIGGHRIVLKHYMQALLFAMTFGLFGILYLYDGHYLYELAQQHVKQCNYDQTVTPDDTADSLLCVACLENRKSVLLLNCYHIATCSTCTEQLIAKHSSCPICRSTIVDAKTVYI